MIKVLIVEDDPMVASINARFLERLEGFSLVGSASTIEEARAVMADQQPELVLLDLYLPRESGMDFLKWIRAQGYRADVILITADKSSAMVQEALRYGAVDYLIKPFTFDRLRDALQRLSQRRAELDQASTLTQEQLDHVILPPTVEPEEPEPEKGINKYTFQLIWKGLIQQGEEYRSAEEISEQTGVATVTVRRYLNYMERDHQIQRQVEYGKIGRPQHRYRIADPGSAAMDTDE